MAAIDPTKHYQLPNDYLALADDQLPFTMEESLGTFCEVWNINSWSAFERLQVDKIAGPEIITDQLKWHVNLYPHGNKTEGYVSLFLETTSCQDQDICAQVLLCMVDPTDPYRFKFQSFEHRFTKDDRDWGFNRFDEMKSLKGQQEEEGSGGEFQKSSTVSPKALIVEDRARIVSIIRLIKDPTGVLWHNFVNYDSKAMTGYVGLYNQGATCYMNSLFQSLFFTNAYRKAVYQVPTENDDPNNSIVLAFQRMFYKLQFSNIAVSTTELTKSFGWNTLDSFMQHDVQEFNRLLQDNIEKKMRGTPAEDAIKQLFVGRMKSYIKCMNVDFESSRSEDYYDIQLNVKGCKNLEESFRNYVLEETLEGDNKYMAEGHGLQDAKKGVIFESFPPVLHLQLKRFEYDMMKDSMIKINDRHEFPTEINLEPYLSESAKEDKSTSYNYILHGVLVHTGNLTGGHYFAFVRPTKENKWFKFDDDRVIPATLNEVLEANFGGQTQQTDPKYRHVKRHTNAYMLVYIRESDQDQVLAEVTSNDIPTHLVEHIKEEEAREEEEARQRAIEHLYMTCFIATDKSFFVNKDPGFISVNAQAGFDSDAPIQIKRVPRYWTLEKFMMEYAEENGTEPDQFRVWNMCNKRNGTVRLEEPFTPIDYEHTLEDICYRVSTMPHLRFYIEYGIEDPDTEEAYFPDPREETMLFIKLFDPIQQSLRPLGSTYAEIHLPISAYYGEFKESAGLGQGTEIDVFEEVTPQDVYYLDPDFSVYEHQLFDGDVLVVQVKLSDKIKAQLEEAHLCPTIPDYYDMLTYRVRMKFVSIDNPQQDPLFITLRDDMTYLQVVARLAKELNCPASHIMLKPPARYGTSARYIKHDLDCSLYDIRQLIPITKMQPSRDKMFYRVLHIPLAEYEKKKNIQLFRINDGQIVDVLVLKTSKIAGLYSYVISGDEDSDKEEEKEEDVDMDKDKKDKEAAAAKVRIYKVDDDKVTKVFEPTEVVETCILDGEILYAEILPEDEVNKKEQDYYVSVFHYEKELSKTHSIPFKFLVMTDEQDFDAFKKRLQLKCKLDDEVWNQVKVYFITKSKTTPLNQDNFSKLLDQQPKEDVQLGLEHVDPTGKYAAMDYVKTGALHFKN